MWSPTSGSDLPVDERLRDWSDAGLISVEQADAIRRFEHLADVVEPHEPERLGLAAEVAAYLGSVLALMGGIVVVGQRWEDLALPGRLSIAAAVALVGFAAGSWLVHLDEPGTRRLGSLLWVVGVAGAGLAVGVTLHELDVDAGVTAIVIGVVVGAIGLGLWRNLDRPLQLLTMAVGAGIVIGGVTDVADLAPWRVGIVSWLLAVVFFGAAAAGYVRPRLIALIAAAAGAMLAAAMMSDLDERLGPAVAAMTAAGVVVFALWDHSLPMLVAGVVGFLISVQALLATTFTGVASSSVVTLVGLGVVIVTVVRARGHHG